MTEALIKRVRACRLCRDAPEKLPGLPHEPRPVLQISKTATLCIAGQAPGTRVHASGRPFTDPSGVRLRQWLGISEDVFYDSRRIAIVPMGFCFPGNDAKGGDLPPRAECARKWRAEVFAAMPEIKLIVLLGAHAMRWHIEAGGEANRGLSGIVADWRRIFEQPRTPRLLPLPHPSWRNNAWLRRNPWFESELLPVLRAEVNRCLPS